MPDNDEGIDEETLALERELLALGRAEQLAVLQRPEMVRPSDAPGKPALVLEYEGEVRAPAWQFEPGVLEPVRDVAAVFGASRLWQAYDFLTLPEPLLGGRVPLDLLREGNRAEVHRVAPFVAGLEQGAL